jgi:hypothetical protein
MHVAADVLASAMAHRRMFREELVGIAVKPALVGVEIRFAVNVLSYDLAHGRFVGDGDVEGSDRASTLQ